MYEYDSSLIFVPFLLMQKFLNLNKKVDFFEIYVDNFSQIQFVKNQLKEFFPNYLNIIDWRDLNPTLI